MEVSFYFFSIIVFSAALRWLPHLISPHGVGIDHWYWKAYIEEYRENRSFPPSLPQFLLDSHQWYPPIFPLLMAKLPKEVFDKNSHLIAIAIDLLRLALLMSAAHLLGGKINSLIGAGLVYATTPILISYNVQLNPRGLSALFLDILVLLLVWLIWHDGSIWGWVLVALVAGSLLLTHKMTTQLFWFLCITSGLWFQDWRLLMLVPLSILSALILSKGFYLNILKAHWDIVTFWNRNWRWLSSHPVLESPVYGKSDYETPKKYFFSGVKGFFRLIGYLIGFNPWGWIVFLASLWMYGGDPMHTNLTNEDAWMVQWLGLILAFMLMVTFIPFMRCIGQGYLYNYNAAFPVGLLVAMIWGGLKHDIIVEYLLFGTFLVCFSSICFYLWKLKRSKTQKIDLTMDNALNHLKELPNGAVMCFPLHWSEIVAYKTKKSVLWGAHGYGFKLLEPVFPRMLKPISEIVKKYQIKYLLTYEDYLPENFLAELHVGSLVSFGTYRLYTLE